MPQSPERSPRPPAGRGGRGGGFPIGRALIVLVAFVVTTVLVLGAIHPSPAVNASGPTVTTTTLPAHPASTTTTVPPSRVPVLVANASGVTNAAGAVTTELQTGGWDLLPPVDASSRVATSNVYYLAGQQPAALAIATSLHLPASSVIPYTTSAPVTSIGTAEVVVVVGPALANQATSTTTAVN